MSTFIRLWQLFALVSLTACSSLHHDKSKITETVLSKEQRQQQVAQLEQWQITGKLAFIAEHKRESANLFWQSDQKTNQQRLKLTTYLGINVLSLASANGIHTVDIDGETYHSDNLEQLIYQLTELTLPTQAMQYWLKGLRWSPVDKIIYDKITGLPKQLSSSYNGLHWQISYADYHNYNHLPLAQKITIKQAQLTIKIHINQWTL